jgi:RNA polymerase sigma-B factor
LRAFGEQSGQSLAGTGRRTRRWQGATTDRVYAGHSLAVIERLGLQLREVAMAVIPTTEPLARTVSSHELFKRWRDDRDRRARELLIERFLPLARKLARRYSSSNEPYDDLVQVASLGLVKAVERFDPDRGFAFTSFAVPTIVGELKRYFRDTAWALHVDRSAQERARKIAEARREIGARRGGAPTVLELAEYLECTSEEVVDGLQIGEAFDTVSLDAPRPSDRDAAISRLEAIGDDDERLGMVDDQATIFAAAQHLPKRERQILYLRFNEDLTQTEIAERVGVSQMQVSRLLRRSLQRLREICA